MYKKIFQKNDFVLTKCPTHVDQLMVVTSAKILQDRGIVEVGQVSHILAHGELWRVHLLKVILLDLLGLEKRVKRGGGLGRGY